MIIAQPVKLPCNPFPLEFNISFLDDKTVVGDFTKYAFPLVRAIFPELIANTLVEVQPMLGPTSTIFYMDIVYKSKKKSSKKTKVKPLRSIRTTRRPLPPWMTRNTPIPPIFIP